MPLALRFAAATEALLVPYSFLVEAHAERQQELEKLQTAGLLHVCPVPGSKPGTGRRFGWLHSPPARQLGGCYGLVWNSPLAWCSPLGDDEREDSCPQVEATAGPTIPRSWKAARQAAPTHSCWGESGSASRVQHNEACPVLRPPAVSWLLAASMGLAGASHGQTGYRVLGSCGAAAWPYDPSVT